PNRPRAPGGRPRRRLRDRQPFRATLPEQTMPGHSWASVPAPARAVPRPPRGPPWIPGPGPRHSGGPRAGRRTTGTGSKAVAREFPQARGSWSKAYLGAMRPEDILLPTPSGVCCKRGGFHIDPTRAVDKALITHGHSDHARAGHGAVLATQETL